MNLDTCTHCQSILSDTTLPGLNEFERGYNAGWHSGQFSGTNAGIEDTVSQIADWIKFAPHPADGRPGYTGYLSKAIRDGAWQE